MLGYERCLSLFGSDWTTARKRNSICEVPAFHSSLQNSAKCFSFLISFDISAVIPLFFFLDIKNNFFY